MIPAYTRGAHGKRLQASAGQAMIEFVVGLVAILAIAGLLFQLAQFARRHTLAMIEARERAGQAAMDDIYRLTLPGPKYIGDWQEGPDGIRYSADDTPTSANPGIVRDPFVKHVDPARLDAWVGENPISLLNTGPVLSNFAFVHGRAEAEPVPVLPVVRHLLYNKEVIDVEFNTWLVWTKGLGE